MSVQAQDAPPSEALLCLRSLSVERAQRRVLSGVDLTVGPGEVLFVVGPNGSGKSTLLDACLALVPTHEGEIFYAGRALGTLSYAERPHFMALVGREESEALGFTVADVLSLANSESASAAPSSGVLAQEAPWVSDELLSRKLAHLSQGERQRVHICRGFLQGAKVVFWDEATAHLDLAHREEALRMARGYADRGNAVVVVVHELELALRHASRVLVLDRGQPVALGAPKACLSRELLSEVFGLRAEVTGPEGSLGLRWER